MYVRIAKLIFRSRIKWIISCALFEFQKELKNIYANSVGRMSAYLRTKYLHFKDDRQSNAGKCIKSYFVYLIFLNL